MTARWKTRRKRSKACHRYRQMTSRTSPHEEVLLAANLSKELLKGRSPQVAGLGRTMFSAVLTKAGVPLLLLTNNYLTYLEFSRYLSILGNVIVIVATFKR